MESWSSFASEGKTLFFSDDPDWPVATKASALIADESSSSIGGGMGLSEILCGGGGSNGGLISPNSSESVSRALNSSQESSLIALKLGRALATTQASPSPSAASKRARSRGCYAQTAAFCQVLGCNLDLSGSKDYHKKHRVCDVHSKTPKVIVNGVEQRFCQQCSRFHLLSEFDDGKRSCRRRLAGHNERRRKPHFDGLSDKTHKFSHSYHQGARYLGNSMQKRMPFVFSDILPGAIMSPGKHEQVNHFGHIKFEDDPILGAHQLAAPLGNSQFLSKSFEIYPHGGEKQQCASEIPPRETEDYFFNSGTTIQKSLGASDSPRALSLLSAQSQISSHSAGIQTANSPLMLQVQAAHQPVSHLSDRPSRARPMERHGPNGFYSCGVGPVGMDQLEPMMVFPATHAGVDFEVVSDRAFQGSNYLHSKYCLAPEHGSTVDLLQLSSHLQRVEHHRNFMQVKQENEDFCCFQTA